MTTTTKTVTLTAGSYTMSEEASRRWGAHEAEGVEAEEPTRRIHVTRVDAGGGVHGHTTDHCDEAGCAGDELFFRDVDGEGVSAGDVIEA
jgi:hypothetical protein